MKTLILLTAIIAIAIARGYIFINTGLFHEQINHLIQNNKIKDMGNKYAKDKLNP